MQLGFSCGKYREQVQACKQWWLKVVDAATTFSHHFKSRIKRNSAKGVPLLTTGFGKSWTKYCGSLQNGDAHLV